MPRLTTGSPGSQPEPERRAHVVAGARADEDVRRQAELGGGPCATLRPSRGARPLGSPASSSATPASASTVASYRSVAVDHQPVPDASPRSVTRRGRRAAR